MDAQKKELDSFPLLDEYFAYMEAIRGRSPGTIKEYHYDLSMFFRFLKRHRRLVSPDTELSAIPLDDIDIDFLKKVSLTECYAFLSFMTRERKASPANRARKVASIKGFFRYLKTKAALLPVDPTTELEAPRKPRRLPTYLNLDEARQLLAAADDPSNRFSERDYCIITLFLNCGMRLSELCQINIGDISEDRLTVIGKGNKERTIYLNGACLQAIERYLGVRPQQGLKDKTALFVSRHGNRISRSSVQKMIKKYILMAGLDPRRYSTHKLRHTAATLMHKYGHVDIRMLQLILGHESVATTEIYTHVDVDDLHTAVENNPLAGERSSHEQAGDPEQV